MRSAATTWRTSNACTRRGTRSRGWRRDADTPPPPRCLRRPPLQTIRRCRGHPCPRRGPRPRRLWRASRGTAPGAWRSNPGDPAARVPGGFEPDQIGGQTAGPPADRGRTFQSPPDGGRAREPARRRKGGTVERHHHTNGSTTGSAAVGPHAVLVLLRTCEGLLPLYHELSGRMDASGPAAYDAPVGRLSAAGVTARLRAAGHPPAGLLPHEAAVREHAATEDVWPAAIGCEGSAPRCRSKYETGGMRQGKAFARHGVVPHDGRRRRTARETHRPQRDPGWTRRGRGHPRPPMHRMAEW